MNVLEVAMQDNVMKDCKRHAVNVHYLTCTIARLVKAFKEGQQNVRDMPRPGHPAVWEEDVQSMNALVLAYRNATVRELANDAGLVSSTVLNILKKRLGMWKIASRWVPYDLIENHLTQSRQ